MSGYGIINLNDPASVWTPFGDNFDGALAELRKYGEEAVTDSGAQIPHSITFKENEWAMLTFYSVNPLTGGLGTTSLLVSQRDFDPATLS